jgi:hypothetical protein
MGAEAESGLCHPRRRTHTQCVRAVACIMARVYRRSGEGGLGVTQDQPLNAWRETHPCLHATMSAVCFFELAWSMA